MLRMSSSSRATTAFGCQLLGSGLIGHGLGEQGPLVAAAIGAIGDGGLKNTDGGGLQPEGHAVSPNGDWDGGLQADMGSGRDHDAAGSIHPSPPKATLPPPSFTPTPHILPF